MIVWEHKQYNRQKIAYMASTGLIPRQDYWQCVHQMAVTGAEKLIYTCGNPDDYEVVELEYPTDDVLKVIQGWKQFDEDLKSFTPPEAKPSNIEYHYPDLPAIRIEATGMVTSSNLGLFSDRVMDFIDTLACMRAVPQSPQGVAQATEDAKWCKSVEDKIKDAKDALLAQTADINDVIQTLDGIGAEARSTRLKLEKVVKAAQDQRKNEIIGQAIDDLASHCAKLGIDAPDIRKDIENEMKGKRKVESLIDAAGTVLTNAKLAATEEYAARQNLREWVMNIRIAVNRPSRDTEQDVLLSLHQALKDVGTIIGINQHKEAA